MKKILFNDKFGLTAAVLAGTKKQTRRIINAMPKEPRIAYGLEDEAGYVHLLDGYTVVAKSKYKIGEVVAVTQPYKDISTENTRRYPTHYPATSGLNNKVHARADEMPHRIRIEKIRVASIKELKQLLGKPNCNSTDYKTKVNYYLILCSDAEGYRAITLYDYKHEKSIKANEQVEWHIGGNGSRETFIAKEVLEYYLGKLRNGEIHKTKVGKKCPLGLKKKSDIDCVECRHLESIEEPDMLTCIKKEE